MLPKDYVRFRLTGDRAIDQADASGTLRSGCGEPCLVVSVSHGSFLQSCMSRLMFWGVERSRRGGYGFGTLVAGAGDQAAGAVGMGIVRAGVERGTWRGVCGNRPAGARSARSAAYVLSRNSRPLARDGRDPGSGSFVRWFRDTFGVAKNLAAAGDRDPYEFSSEEKRRQRLPERTGCSGRPT